MLEAKYGSRIDFRQASVDALPFPDESMDVITSEAVYEHVHNLRLAASEMFRVLKPGGIAFHGVGPFYFCFGGDHCISEYGFDAGFDHVLLDDRSYRQQVSNGDFCSDKPDPNCNFWAIHYKFSFATPIEFFEAFSRYFEFEHLTVIVSPNSLQFREKFPDRWRTMLDAGLTEESLCVKSVHVGACRSDLEVV